VGAGEFRSDLYYRINGLAVQLPALRQRQDMARLIQMILQIEQAPQVTLSEEVMALFATHPWPGNVRQLHNVLRTAVALAEGGVIQRQHLTHDFLDEMAVATELMATAIASTAVGGNLKEQSEAAIRQAMLQHGGNISAVARQLGISRNTLYRRLKELDLA
jgi:sigma-54 dependent transcriptional regulator, acetoin dehydrogenase operon transcriptional activator AcoR